MVEFMDLNYLDSTEDSHRFCAPFEPCRNQLNLGFGGAIATGLTLAGWFSFTQAAEALRNEVCNPVVAKAELQFLRPFVEPELLFVAPRTALTETSGRLRATLTTHLMDSEHNRCAEATLNFVL